MHHELENPHRPWSGSEDAVMQWAAHFWNVDSGQVVFPWNFEEFYFQRWIIACHLRQKMSPALTLSTAARERALEDELRSCGRRYVDVIGRLQGLVDHIAWLDDPAQTADDATWARHWPALRDALALAREVLPPRGEG